MEFKHVSVLLEGTIDSLNICPDGIYVDGTTGGGGHSYEIAKRLGDKGRLICIDQDAEALAAARVRLAPFEENFRTAGVLVPANADVPRILVVPCGRFGRKSRKSRLSRSAVQGKHVLSHRSR